MDEEELLILIVLWAGKLKIIQVFPFVVREDYILNVIEKATHSENCFIAASSDFRRISVGHLNMNQLEIQTLFAEEDAIAISKPTSLDLGRKLGIISILFHPEDHDQMMIVNDGSLIYIYDHSIFEVKRTIGKREKSGKYLN